ncbi:MAG: nicotinate (nicotinamide) nucleotide adenylyltransferase [Verrucomicrobiota bacterium]
MSAGSHGLALFGGTFDPFHNGHLRMAIEVREALGLPRLFLVPAAQPPHKPNQPVSPAQHRLAMVQAAVAGIEGISVLDVELRREGPSYTLLTVREVRAANAGADVLLLIGADAFFEIATWYRYEELLAECDFLLLPRPRSVTDCTSAPGVRLELEESGCYSLPGRSFRLPGGRKVLCPDFPVLDISSRSIRDKVRRGRSIRGLVPPEVERYIAAHGLYREEEKRG